MGSYSFIFIAIAIILVFVVLYYSYNFLFSTIGTPVPAVIITNAMATTGPLKPLTTSFTAPYEGGDFTVTFWLYMAENSLAGGNANYRKHIIDIGGNSFSTFAIGIDAGTNNLIVRTHTGGGGASGVSSTTSIAANSGTAGSPNYVTAGGQTFFGGLNGATYPCYSILGQLSSLISGSNNCITARPTTSSSMAGKCTSQGRLNRAGTTNIGWDADCNPCDGYWVASGTGGTNGGTNGGTTTGGTGTSGGSSDEIYTTYTSPCLSKCMWSCDGTFSGAERRNGGTGGTTGGTGGSANCTWSRTTATYPGCGSGSPSTSTSTSMTTTSSSTPTVSLGTTTLDSLFNSPAVSSGDSTTPCDVPGIDLQRWTHVTVVLSGKITDVYMNGKLARSCIGASYFKVDASPIKINLLRYGKYFNGKLANLNLYTVALNPAQIYDMYTKGPTSS